VLVLSQEAPDNCSLGTASIIEETPPPEPRETPPPLPIDYECVVPRADSPIEPRHPSVEIPEPAPCQPQPRPYRHPHFRIYQQVRRRQEQDPPTEIKVEDYFELLITLVKFLPLHFRRVTLGDLVRLTNSFADIVTESTAKSQHLFIQLAALWWPQQ
jgi:hypothetical protein